MDALSHHYCHSVGVRKLESSGKQMAHKDTERVQRIILPIPQSPPSLLQSPSLTERKNVVSDRVSIGRRVVVLLAMVLVAATLATMSAASAFADDGLSDSQLRHKINVIQNRPGPLTNQERDHIQNLRERIHDNDDDDD